MHKSSVHPADEHLLLHAALALVYLPRTSYTMDKGAARSRKLAEKAAKAEQSGSSIAVADNPVLRRLNESDSNSGRGRGSRGGRGGPGGSGNRGRGGRGGAAGSRRPYEAREGQDGRAREDRPPRPERAKKPELDEAVRYKPKAIRTSAALIWSEGAFEVPPKPERLEGVRRVDLSGSGITDVSWIKGGVTWLSLAGCPVEKGWEAIGDLNELSGTSLLTLSILRDVLTCSAQHQRMWLDSFTAELGQLEQSQGDCGYEQRLDSSG